MKKIQHQIIALSLAILLIFTLAACAGGTNGDSGGSLTTKTGVLVEVSQHVISIQAPDGTTYTFGVNENTTIEGSELLGNTVSASFYGEYSSGVIAVSIKTITEVDHANSSEKGSTDDPGASQPREPSSTDDTIWYMTGTVKDITSNSLQLLYEDRHTYLVTIDNNTKVDKEVVVGSTARVFHKGRMVDGMVATEIHFIPREETIRYFTGTVKDLTANSLQLLYEDGHTYLVTIDNNTKVDKKVVIGCTARVFHKGELADGMVATEIHFIPREDTVRYFTGTVKDLTANSLQLLYEDGHTYLITIDDKTIVDRKVVVDSTARVFHKGELADGMVAIEVHFISDAQQHSQP